MADDHHEIASPPGIAVRFMALAVREHDRSAVLGDLHEEFLRRHDESSKQARTWYWRQVVLSAPYLVRQRMQHSSAYTFGVTLIVTLLSFALITFWDVYIARTTAQLLAQQGYGLSLLVLRIIYFLIQLTGTALVGGLIARTLFTRKNRFRDNVVTRLLPTALIIIAGAMATWISAGGNYPLAYLMLRVGLSIPALLIGALVVNQRLRH